MSDSGQIVAEDSSEWLPAGWAVGSKLLRSGRRVDMYTNIKTGKRLFSKDDVLHYNFNCGNPHSTDKSLEIHSDKSLEMHSEIDSSPIMNENERPEWLPKGWKVVMKTRCSGESMGRKYKIFIEPLNGYRFFSKPEVIRYLSTGEEKSCRPRYLQTVKRKKKSISEKKNIDMSKQSVMGDVEGLPPGWIKKIKVRSFNPSKKDPFYIDPVSGYAFRSKKDVIRYLKTGDINQCAYRPKKMCINDQDLTSDEAEVTIINENEHPEWLPKDWKVVVKIRCSGESMGRKYKIFIDPLNGYRFFSKPEVIRYLTTGERKSCRPRYLQTAKRKKKGISEKNNIGTSEQSVLSDVEGLPPGWIKEIKVRSFNPSKKDPFYIDPVSGYAFRSKKDVMRYLKTGDINQCAYRPKKMCRNDQDLTSDAEPSMDKKQKLNHPASRRLLFADEMSSETSILALSKSVDNFRSSDPGAARVDIRQQKFTLESSFQESAKTKQNHASDSSPPSEAEMWKVTPGIRNFAETGHDSTPAPDIRQEENSLVGKTHIKSGKSREKKLLSLSRRCSKRLAGLEPYDVVTPFPAKQAPVIISEYSGAVEATRDVSLMENNLVNVASKQRKAGKQTELPYPASFEAEKKDKEKPEQKLDFLFDSDPCLEFAFKTLTGELPVTDTADKGPICYPSADTLESKYLLDSEMKNCHSAKLRGTSSKSRRCKGCNLPQRFSKRLAGLEPELEVQCRGTKPIEIEATGAADRSKTSIENYAYSNMSTSGEPWNKTIKSLEDPIVPREEPQMHGTQRAELGKFEPQLSFPLGNCWSDRSCDFSYKTLTSAMPMEDSLLQGSFKEHLNSSQNQKDNCFVLPDYSSFSFFRSDIPSHFDTSLGSVSSQQNSPNSSSFLAAGNLSLPSCSNSQEQCLEGKTDFAGKVKS